MVLLVVGCNGDQRHPKSFALANTSFFDSNMMATLAFLTVTCAVVCCGTARLKRGASSSFRGPGHYMELHQQPGRQASMVRCGDVVNHCCAWRYPIQSSKPWWQQSEWKTSVERLLVVLTWIQESPSRCDGHWQNHSRLHVNPHPAWYSSVMSTVPSHPPGFVHYHKYRLTALEFRKVMAVKIPA